MTAPASHMRKWVPPTIDPVDRQIIARLQVNGRAPYADIARSCGLSEALVRARVAKLRERGVIQIVAVTDPLQLGFSREACIGIKAHTDPESLADQLSEIDAVDFVVLVGGRFDILLEVIAESDEAFLDLVNRIRSMVEPGSVLVLPYLKTWMQEYAWGAH